MTSTRIGRLARRTPSFSVRPAATRVTPVPTTPSRVRGRKVAASFPGAAPTGSARGVGDTRKTAEAKA
jgi:hypothetical protein